MTWDDGCAHQHSNPEVLDWNLTHTPGKMCARCISLRLSLVPETFEFAGSSGDPVCGPLTVGVSMFWPLTTDQASLLGSHLTSGWNKQRVVWPYLAGREASDEAWQETGGLLDDLHEKHDWFFSGRRE